MANSKKLTKFLSLKNVFIAYFLQSAIHLHAGSFAMLYYKNNYHQAVDCWVNGVYQGVIPAHSTKYMPSEGFVTADSGWRADGTLVHKQAYGGWSPTSPAEVVTVAISGLGAPLVYWTGKFSATESGLYLKLYNLDKAIDALDVEFANGMFKGTPKNLAILLGDKKFAPKPELDGASVGGNPYTAMEESNIVFDDEKLARPPYTIRIRRVSDEEYIVRMIDDGKEVFNKRFDNETDQSELLVNSYIPKGRVSIIVTWVGDRPGGSPPEYSNIWISVNGQEYGYDQNNGLDWNGGRYGESIRLKLKEAK
ncbi:MAG: hypothetical protein KA116_06505 [Proteobacteria bacterium]|nr:hypothetical protein [Pseudomonadota bacterium]